MHDFIMDLTDAERTRIQNLMIGGFLFKDEVKEKTKLEVDKEIQILEREVK